MNLIQERKIREKIYQKNVNIYQNWTFFGPKLDYFQEIVPQIEISGVLTKISCPKLSKSSSAIRMEFRTFYEISDNLADELMASFEIRRRQ